MTVKFINTENKKGSPLYLKLGFKSKIETDPDLTLAGNFNLSTQVQERVNPNLTNALIRLRFYNYSDRLKTSTAIPLLSVTNFETVKNTTTERVVTASITGAQTALWKPGNLWYSAAIQPIGGEWIFPPHYSGSFILIP